MECVPAVPRALVTSTATWRSERRATTDLALLARRDAADEAQYGGGA